MNKIQVCIGSIYADLEEKVVRKSIYPFTGFWTLISAINTIRYKMFK